MNYNEVDDINFTEIKNKKLICRQKEKRSVLHVTSVRLREGLPTHKFVL